MPMWEEDKSLRVRLMTLVKESYSQSKILQLITTEFSEYSWSLRTLQRRLSHFGLSKCEPKTDVNTILQVVKDEVAGSGGVLGYRALHRKIKIEHNLFPRRSDVYQAMSIVCPEKLKARRLENQRKVSNSNREPESQLIICEICGKVLKSSLAYKSHKAFEHFKCEHCYFATTSLAAFELHCKSENHQAQNTSDKILSPVTPPIALGAVTKQEQPNTIYQAIQKVDGVDVIVRETKMPEVPSGTKICSWEDMKLEEMFFGIQTFKEEEESEKGNINVECVIGL